MRGLLAALLALQWVTAAHAADHVGDTAHAAAEPCAICHVVNDLGTAADAPERALVHVAPTLPPVAGTLSAHPAESRIRHGARAPPISC